MKNTHPHRKLLIAGLAALLLGSGCASVGTVEPRDRQAPSHPVTESVRFDDEILRRSVAVEGANLSTASGDLPRAQVVLLSTRSRTQNLAYQFEWYDSDGMRIESVTSVWKPLRLFGHESVAVSDVAPNPRAVDFVLKIRRT